MKRLMLLIFSFLMFIACGQAAQADIKASQLKEIPNVVQLEENVIGGGRLNEKIIKKAKKLGVKTIIDLRGPEEGAGTERILVKKYNLNYFNVPVTLKTIRKAQADVIAHVIQNEENRPVIIHCSSGNRAGGVWGLYAKFYKNLSSDEAYKEAVKKGLRNDQLKTRIKELMGN